MDKSIDELIDRAYTRSHTAQIMSTALDRLTRPDRGTGTGLYAMVTKVGIAILSDLESMSVTPRRYS